MIVAVVTALVAVVSMVRLMSTARALVAFGRTGDSLTHSKRAERDPCLFTGLAGPQTHRAFDPEAKAALKQAVHISNIPWSSNGG